MTINPTVGSLLDLVELDLPTEKLLDLDEASRKVRGKPLADCTDGDLVMIKAAADMFAAQCEATTTVVRYMVDHLRSLEAEVAGCQQCRVIVPNGANGEPDPISAFAIHIPAIGCTQHRPDPPK